MMPVFRARTRKNKRKIPPGLGKTCGMQGKSLWRCTGITQRDAVQRLVQMCNAHSQAILGKSQRQGNGMTPPVCGKKQRSPPDLLQDVRWLSEVLPPSWVGCPSVLRWLTTPAVQ